MTSYYFQRQRQPDTDINILLLGETGVGKTTFINAFINYLTYNTLDEASHKEVKLLATSTFSVTDNKTYKTTQVMIGNPDDNESRQLDGASSTQACRSYVFRFANRWIRIIDGPGVGDTRGVDHESRNFDNIMAYISQYEHLNGILILLKPALTRLNIYFRYCIKQLLRHLHRSAADNIMFIFTNSRSTFFKPGETTPILKNLLTEMANQTGVEVPFDQSNTFMFDNEGFRFLAAYKQGVRFIMDDKKSYEESWQKSVEQIDALMKKILSCGLHAVQYTQSLNEAQQLIRQLSRPVAEVKKLIQENIALAAQYKEKIMKNREPTNFNHQLPQKVGRFVPLKQRLTVCISPKCTRVTEVNGEVVIEYKQQCHIGCSLKTVVQECIGHPAIQRCRAIRKRSLPSGFCRHCECHWQKHMHITYKIERSTTGLQLGTDEKTRTPTAILVLIDQRITVLRREEKQIRDICVKLSGFLRANSITPFNDDLIEYMTHFLNEEKQKQVTKQENPDLIRSLEESIEAYKKDVQLYTSSIQSIVSKEDFVPPEKIDEIYNLVEQLYNLRINGAFIRDQMTNIKRIQIEDVQNQEEIIDLSLTTDSPKVLHDLKTLLN